MNKLASSIIPTTLLTLALFAALNPAAPLARAEEREEHEREHHREREHGHRGERKERKEGAEDGEKKGGREKEGDDVIERVMKVCCKAPKGTPTLAQKVVDGTATEDETKKLIASYRTLKGTKPPKGELADWNTRVGDLMEAMDALEKKEKDAADKFDSSNTCKSCHRAHK
jgi:hypothetical protein